MAVKYVGPQAAPDGLTPFDSDRVGRTGARIVTRLYGHDHESAARGGMYICSSAAAGIALIAPATGGGHPTLINPAGSLYLLAVKKLTLTYVSGNNAPGGVEWAYSTGIGAGPATGTQLLTATKVAPVNAVVGAPQAPAALYWSPTTNTFTAAPTFLCGTGLSLFTGVAATAVAPFKLEADYDNGALEVYPGAALSLCTDVATTTALFQVAIWVEEIPI